jgi:hypothetical protein
VIVEMIANAEIPIDTALPTPKPYKPYAVRIKIVRSALSAKPPLQAICKDSARAFM